VSAEADRDLELLLAEVRSAAARFGAKSIRSVLLAFTGHADVETASNTHAARGGPVTLTAYELAMCQKRGLDPAKMTATKAKAIADGVYPAAPE
jgi:hypothetical protein